MKLIKKVVFNILFYIKLLSFYLKTLTDKTAWIHRKLLFAQKVLDIVNKKCSNELTENIQKLINDDNTVFDGIDAVLVEKKHSKEMFGLDLGYNKDGININFETKFWT